jgi:hypothetical protein
MDSADYSANNRTDCETRSEIQLIFEIDMHSVWGEIEGKSFTLIRFSEMSSQDLVRHERNHHCVLVKADLDRPQILFSLKSEVGSY